MGGIRGARVRTLEAALERRARRLEAARMGAAAMAVMAADILRRTTTSSGGRTIEWPQGVAGAFEEENKNLRWKFD